MNRRTLFLTAVLLFAAALQGCAIRAPESTQVLLRDLDIYAKVIASWPGESWNLGTHARYCANALTDPACKDRSQYDFVYVMVQRTAAIQIKAMFFAPKSAVVQDGDIIAFHMTPDDEHHSVFLRIVRKEADRGPDCDWTGSRYFGRPESVRCEGWTYEHRTDDHVVSSAH